MTELRRRAETMMEGQTLDLGQLSGDVVQHLFHELRVHQIELEIQNEELRQMQQELEASRNRYIDLYDFAPVGYLTVNDQGLIVEANLTCEALFGRERRYLLRLSIAHLLVKDDEEHYYLTRQKILAAKTPQTCELRMRRQEDARFDAHLECVPVMDPAGEVVQIRIAITDITKLKHAEKQLRLAVRELHHRTKNNMAVIDSLLSFQSQGFDDQRLVACFQEARNRILSMTMVHEQLYREDLASVPLREYIDRMACWLVQSYAVGQGQIRLRQEVEPIVAAIDFAIPFGLLLNELITNAMKYAFPNEREGELFISLRTTADNGIELRVRDDGVGFAPPEDGSFKESKTLGLQLIGLLTEQLSGVIECPPVERGAEFLIRFPQPRA